MTTTVDANKLIDKFEDMAKRRTLLGIGNTRRFTNADYWHHCKNNNGIKNKLNTIFNG